MGELLRGFNDFIAVVAEVVLEGVESLAAAEARRSLGFSLDVSFFVLTQSLLR